MDFVRSYFLQNPYFKRNFFFFFQIHAAEDQEEEALKFLPVGGKISIECDPKYDPDTFMKTTRTFTITKKSRSRCDVTESGIIEVPPNFEGAYTGYPQAYAMDVPCPSDPCKTG